MLSDQHVNDHKGVWSAELHRVSTHDSNKGEVVAEELIETRPVRSKASCHWLRLKAWYKQKILLSGSGLASERTQKQTWIERRLGISGWRVGVLASCVSVGVCLLVEVVLLIAALSKDAPSDAGQGILFQGSCAQVKKNSFLLLIPINIIATVIISCSNYVMQCMSAPSRADLDRAHDMGYHVHIGVSSVRNNFHNGTVRQLSWWVIGATSIPIHLMLNSVVFVTLQTNNYLLTIVSLNFQSDPTWSICDTAANRTFDSSSQICDFYKNLKESPDQFQSYSPEGCIGVYQDNIQATASNVFVLTNSSNRWDDFKWEDHGVANKSIGFMLPANESVWEIDSFRGAFAAFDYRALAFMEMLNYKSDDPRMYAAAQFGPNSWLCEPQNLAETGDACNQYKALQRISNFTITPSQLQVNQCLTKKAQQHCTLEYSFVILAITISCDVIKLIAMLLFLRKALKPKKNQNSDDEPIATLGDAIQSYLKRPDEHTIDRCLVDQIHIRYQSRFMTNPQNFKPINLRLALPWKIVKYRWATVPSKSRWLCFYIPFIGLLAGTEVILYYNIYDLHQLNIHNIWTQGFGKVDPNAIFTSSTFTDRSILRASVVINIPQLLFSYLYFVYNGLYTCMHIGKEWSQFVKVPTYLRVSQPQGRQRSTYWLSLPWRYSIPLIVFSGLLHWLVSRSLYLVRINVYGSDGQLQLDNTISAYGFSPLATILVLCSLVLMLLIAIGFSLRRLESGIPMVGTNSFAISAACHDQSVGKEPVLKPLMWGVVNEGVLNQPGHCAITTRNVSMPIEGKLYQ